MIFDCGATKSMTFDPRDLLSHDPTNYTHIKLANGDHVHVDCEAPIDISSSLKLKHDLLIPILSYKFLSISQLTKVLNCTVLMTAHGCVVQDAQIQKIICYGTENGGLYYLDNAILVLRRS